ncbi:MAG TPA: DUF1800 domain-containing protein [Thermoanaerobaculia bacterium]|jgi:uncharacterized protein (DUF1800 family)|nr:DUF1800 domain-containing protein [Thermoanaerobaculia bacterium]
MKAATLIVIALAAAALCLPPGGGVAVLSAGTERQPSVHLPWKAAGLTEREAAAHLLNRFAYGPRPGQVDEVVKMGLDRWFERQLAGNLPDPRVTADLRPLPALALPSADIVRTYPNPGEVLREAKKAGAVPQDAEKKSEDPEQRKQTRQAVLRWAAQQGYHPQKELLDQLTAQKLYRAVDSENQLAEVMADFWLNHFNVSLTDNKARPWLLSYERDAIRPHALGRMRELLEATARHPAMLLYLDNAQSTAAANATTTIEDEMERRPMRRGRGRFGVQRPPAAGLQPAAKKQRGVNENYARELMELHTLGVDGGYTQADVIQVARAFTGWTIIPPARREEAERRLARAQRAGGLGFATQGDFLFRADMHDAGAKVVLGKHLPAGRGMEDGEDVLDLLAAHPSTARHLATKLAVRFVSDQPSKALVDHLSTVYLQSGGDVRAMLRAIAESPEFWSRQTVGAKIKSPFELAVSAIRSTGAHVDDPQAAVQWISHMGEPLYAYQAPTGYPDRAEAWVNTGSLLNRMNFGLQFASGRVDGVGLDLPALHGGKEPESRQEALTVYANLLLPGRNLDPVLKQLTPMVTDPGLAQKIDDAAPRREAADGDDDTMMMNEGAARPRAARLAKAGQGGARKGMGNQIRPPRDLHPPTPLEQVVGVILGSPEFQRR